MYPGKQPGTLAAAQGGGSEAEAGAYGSTCPTAAPSSTTARGSMRPPPGSCPGSSGNRRRPRAAGLDFPGPDRTRGKGDLFTRTERAASPPTAVCRGLHSLYGQPAVTLRRTSRSTSAVQLFAGSVPLPETSSVMVLLLPAGPVR